MKTLSLAGAVASRPTIINSSGDDLRVCFRLRVDSHPYDEPGIDPNDLPGFDPEGYRPDIFDVLATGDLARFCLGFLSEGLKVFVIGYPTFSAYTEYDTAYMVLSVEATAVGYCNKLD